MPLADTRRLVRRLIARRVHAMSSPAPGYATPLRLGGPRSKGSVADLLGGSQVVLNGPAPSAFFERHVWWPEPSAPDNGGLPLGRSHAIDSSPAVGCADGVPGCRPSPVGVRVWPSDCSITMEVVDVRRDNQAGEAAVAASAVACAQRTYALLTSGSLGVGSRRHVWSAAWPTVLMRPGSGCDSDIWLSGARGVP